MAKHTSNSATNAARIAQERVCDGFAGTASVSGTTLADKPPVAPKARPTSHFTCSWAIALSLTFAMAARAQNREEDPELDGLRSDSANTDVYVNDSFEVADAITRADTLARRGAWSDAASHLQEASDEAQGKLVRVSQGYYVGVRTRINQIIGQWPPQGLEAFRTLYERDVQSEWNVLERLASNHGSYREAGGDLSGLLTLFDRYFCTATGARLADAIGQRAIESGDLVLAEQVYQRVLDKHPDRDSIAPRYAATLALVRAMRGQDVSDATKELSATKIRWKGADRALGSVIDEVQKLFDTRPQEPEPNSWPLFAGDLFRNRTSTTDVDEPGLLWRFDFADPSRRSSDDNDASRMGTGRDRSSQLTMNPVVDGSFVYVQRGRGIVAIHRNTGVVAWQFRGSDAESTTLSFLDEKTPGWDSVTLHQGRIYASLPGDPVPYYSYESAGNPAELVCLNAKTGEEVWRLEQNAIEEQFAEISFDASPVVYRDYLLVVGRRRRSFGFEDSYLYCFHAKTGTLRYRTHLGSASTGTFGSRMVTRTVVSVLDDRVFVCSNLGTIAAVSLHTGEVHWLRAYRRNRDTFEDGSSRSKHAKPWHLNPVTIHGDQLITLPRDSSEILVLSQKDGSVLHRIPVAQMAGVRSLLGVKGQLLCGTGESVACFDLQLDTLVWEQPLGEGSRPYGHGAWIDDAILVPTQNYLCSFSITDGKRTDVAWDADGEGGNLLALPNEIIVAGVDQVFVYVRKKEIWKTLQDRMAASPNDPVPALELAEVALNGGEFEEAITILDEAMRRTQTLDGPPDDTLRRRIFDDVLLFVDRLEAKSKLDSPLLDRLFEYASQYPPSPSAHLSYRFHFARLYKRHDGVQQAVRLYHQVLRDRSLRDLPLDPNDTGSVLAGEKAQTQIAELIAEHGRSIYATYEHDAQQRLERAKNDNDEAALHRIVRTYPNSNAAPKALIAQGEILVRRNRAMAGAERFAQAYHRYPRQVDRPAILRKIADAYESGGMRAMAYRWLTKASREHPSVRFLHNGKQVTFLEYRRRLASVRAEVLPARPKVELPLEDFYIQTFDDSSRLLSPRFGEYPGNSWARYFVDTSSGLVAYEARTGQELWSAPLSERQEPELLYANESVAVFATKHQVFTLDAETGETRWSDGKEPPDAEDAMADWENKDRLRTHALNGDRLISVRDLGGMTCRRIDSGDVIWSQTHRPAPAGRVRFSDRWVAYHVVQDGKPVVCLLDAANGNWSGAIGTEQMHALEDIFVTLDSRIIVASSDSIASYDPISRKRRWRIELSGRLRRASLRMDVDALYYSENGHRVVRINVENGWRVWESDGVIPRGDDEINVLLHEGNVLVASASSVSAIDSVNGLTLWRGTKPEDARFVRHMLTDTHLVAVDVTQNPDELHSTAYFYDHRNASGVIAKNGGAPDLGMLDDVRNIMIVDGALLIQTGPTIRAWRHE